MAGEGDFSRHDKLQKLPTMFPRAICAFKEHLFTIMGWKMLLRQ